MIVIIGAGISGLALAHHLAARDCQFVVLESTGRVGGVMRSGRIGDHLLEWGPQRGRLTGDFAALVDELQLRNQLITAPRDLPLFVYARGRLREVPASPAAFIRSDILTWRARMRLLLEPFTAGARSDESVATYFIRKLGREAYENLAGPLYGGLYASDPHDMDVGLSLGNVLRELGVGRSVLLTLMRRRGMVSPVDACSFRDGMDTLPRALHARHATHVRLDTPVLTIERTRSGYSVVTDRETFDAERVVLTTPADVSAGILSDIAPDAARRIGALRYNPLAVVHLRARTALRGLGYQVSLAEALVTRGVTWNDSLFDRTDVYTAYLGGARNPWIARERADSAAALAVAEFRAVTSCDAEPLSVQQERMPAWDRTWSAIESLELPANVHVHSNWIARPGIPGRLSIARRLADRLSGRSS